MTLAIISRHAERIKDYNNYFNHHSKTNQMNTATDKQARAATNGTETKTRKPRAKKASTPQDLMVGIESQPLAVKVNLLGLLKDSIDKDKEILTAQLALIDAIK